MYLIKEKMVKYKRKFMNETMHLINKIK